MGLRNFIIISVMLFCLIFQMGCQEQSRTILAVKFENDSTVRYRVISERNIEVNLDTSTEKGKPSKTFEKLELVMAYSPVGEVQPYGITTMRGVCESAKVTRKNQAGRSAPDAAELLAGGSFTFTISPVGKILDYSEMDKLAYEIANKSIKSSGKQGRIKSPDMVADFVAMQKHLWDSVASIPQGTVGTAEGQTWRRFENIPLPVLALATKEITYTLVDEGQEDAAGEGQEKKVEIQSTFARSEEKVADWPQLYEGFFRVQGMFGFLRNYKFKSIEGSGLQVFNADSGVVESDEQEYRVMMDASFMMPLGGPPSITIDQKITIKLISD